MRDGWRQRRIVLRGESELAMKYAVLKYSTDNVGDEIQSIAARRLLPRVDFYIDRERMREAADLPPCILLANGYFMHRPENFGLPPHVKPIFLSFHVAKQSLLSKRNVAYLKQHEPIGCRDQWTLDMLRFRGVLAYYSGCLTLTLENRFDRRGEDVYLVDLDDAMMELVPTPIAERGARLTQWVPREEREDSEARFKRAEELLECYAKASLVVTTRLHCALPCLALGTPVVLLHHHPGDPRLEIASHYLRIASPRHEPERIDWSPTPVDVSDRASFLRRLCELAVRDGTNPARLLPASERRRLGIADWMRAVHPALVGVRYATQWAGDRKGRARLAEAIRRLARPPSDG
jgi:hypothetical protein